MSLAHSHGGVGHSHSHANGDHGHTHEILDGPGSYLGRELPIVEGRNWEERAFTIGIGGRVPQHSSLSSQVACAFVQLYQRAPLHSFEGDITVQHDNRLLYLNCSPSVTSAMHI